MKNDSDLKKEVLEELEWEPSIDATKVGVSVNNGIVILSGRVNTHGEKLAAEKAAKRVAGVKAVVQEIEVKISAIHKRNDDEIAQMALNSLKWNTNVPEGRIQIEVEDGWITLEGKVDWFYQKEAAKNAVINLAGVRGVNNRIEIRAAVEIQNVKEKIKRAFERHASIDAGNIKVKIDGRKVILEGSVQSWAEKKQAEHAAWSAPGVTDVVDRLEIKSRELAY